MFLLNPKVHPMKFTTPLLSALLATSFPCAAQQAGGEPSPGHDPFAAPTPGRDPFATAPAPQMPAGTRLEKAVFSNSNLPEIIAFLDAKEQDAGGRPLNVILSPGMENLVVPSLNLRNVTTTEVLNIVSTLLGLTLDPVKGDDGEKVVAWLIKGNGNVTAMAPAPAADPLAANAIAAAPGGLGASGAGLPGANSLTLIAASPAPVPGAAAPQSQVFSLASILPPVGASAEARDLRSRRLDQLYVELSKFAVEQDKDAEIRPYPGLDLIVVKSAALPLISQAVEAMSRGAVTAGEASAVQRANEQNAMLAESTAALRAMEQGAGQREAELQKQIDVLTAELAALKKAAGGGARP